MDLLNYFTDEENPDSGYIMVDIKLNKMKTFDHSVGSVRLSSIHASTDKILLR